MSTIVTRAGKGSPLTHTEVDNNFTNLNTDKYQSGNTIIASAGTVSAPALSTTGDTNTGIFFPAADTIAFAEGGVEAMRIDSSGNVGIGTSSPNGKFEVSSSSTGVTVGDFFVDTANKTVYVGRQSSTSADNSIFNVRNRLNTSVFYVDCGQGTVGIGTTSPTFVTGGGLQISNATQATLRLSDTTNSGYNFDLFMNETDAYVANRANGNTLFFTNNTERMRIDSSGNVQIGTTTTATAATALTLYKAGGVELFLQNSTTGTGSNGFRLLANGNDAYLTNKEAGVMIFETSDTERMRIDSSGNVGIGATTPALSKTPQLFVRGNSNTSDDYIATFEANNATAAIGISYQRISSYDNANTAPLIFDTNGSERMRITSGGDVFIGATSALDGERLLSYRSTDAVSATFANSSATGAYTIQVRNYGTSGDRRLIRLMAGSTPSDVGAIYYNGSATVYATSSDYRLKENVAPMTGALEKVSQLKPVTYTWKETGLSGQGFIAHEFQAVFPDAVSGQKDAVDKNGNPEYQGMDVSFAVATLTAAIQELNAKVEAQAAEIALLKSK
jgi:hypothetical protein